MLELIVIFGCLGYIALVATRIMDTVTRPYSSEKYSNSHPFRK